MDAGAITACVASQGPEGNHVMRVTGRKVICLEALLQIDCEPSRASQRTTGLAFERAGLEVQPHMSRPTCLANLPRTLYRILLQHTPLASHKGDAIDTLNKTGFTVLLVAPTKAHPQSGMLCLIPANTHTLGRTHNSSLQRCGGDHRTRQHTLCAFRVHARCSLPNNHGDSPTAKCPEACAVVSRKAGLQPKCHLLCAVTTESHP